MEPKKPTYPFVPPENSLCAKCEWCKSIDVYGVVDCRARFFAGYAKIKCEAFEVRTKK